MARPKGIKQKRDESKYLLPEGVSLKANQTQDFNKDTDLIFIDHVYGEFQSSYKRIQSAGFSVHPLSVQARREQTNLARYGAANAGANKQVTAKRKSTMLARYGVENALQNADIYNKLKEDNIQKFGTDNPLKLKEFQDKAKQTLQETYGVSNAMYSDEIRKRLVETSMSKYGTINPAQSAQSKENYFKTMKNQTFSSKAELEVLTYIKSFNIDAEKDHFGGAFPTEIDIVIPELKLGIDYHGAYFHSEANKKIYPSKHLHKYETCKKYGYKLIQIFDFEWNERQEQVKSFLRSALGKNEFTYYARKCELKEIDKNIAKEFLEKYHILGAGKINTAFGLFYENELVQVLTIALHHRNNKEFVLNRFCGKCNVSVVGGLSRLSTFAREKFGKITTWIDLRFSNGESWVKAGWTLEKQLPIDYFYYNTKNGKIISKQSRQKRLVNTPAGMTEHEHALQDKLARVYDCGKLKLSF